MADTAAQPVVRGNTGQAKPCQGAVSPTFVHGAQEPTSATTTTAAATHLHVDAVAEVSEQPLEGADSTPELVQQV